MSWILDQNLFEAHVNDTKEDFDNNELNPNITKWIESNYTKENAEKIEENNDIKNDEKIEKDQTTVKIEKIDTTIRTLIDNEILLQQSTTDGKYQNWNNTF